MSKRPINHRNFWQRLRKPLTLFILLVLVPITVLTGTLRFSDQKYLFIGLLLIIYALAAFFMSFERRKPQARELVLISVMTAIGVASRVAFLPIPQFKPVAAIVIITGACFGCETGVLVGALTAFVSNFIFMQGPYTPWQMFAFGIIGFLAGLFFHGGLLPKKRFPLCIFGFLTVFLIYGGIMNFSTVLFLQLPLTWSAIIPVYVAAIWFDAVHAAAAVIFLLVLSGPMIKQLERIKIKYDILQGNEPGSKL